MGQSRLSNMQSQTGGSDIQTLEDQDPNEVRFDSRRPVETNIKDMLEKRIKMDATLSAGRAGGGNSAPTTPAVNPVKVENNKWFAPVFNKYADRAYQIALTDPNYQKLKSDKDGDIIDKQKSFLAKLMAEKDIKPSMTEIYDEANKRGLTVSPTDNRFKTIGAAQDIGAYVNDLEIKSRGANQGVWSKYEFYALKPGSNSAYNGELKAGYNKELQRVQEENNRRGGMGFSAELTTSPGNTAEAAIIADKARQGKIEGQLDWGRTVWDKEMGGRRGTVAQIPSFSEPLPQIGEPKPPKYEAVGDDTIKIGVSAYNKPAKTPGGGAQQRITGVDLTGIDGTVVNVQDDLGKVTGTYKKYTKGLTHEGLGDVGFLNANALTGNKWWIKNGAGQKVNPLTVGDAQSAAKDISIVNLFSGKIGNNNVDDLYTAQKAIMSILYGDSDYTKMKKNVIDKTTSYPNQRIQAAMRDHGKNPASHNVPWVPIQMTYKDADGNVKSDEGFLPYYSNDKFEEMKESLRINANALKVKTGQMTDKDSGHAFLQQVGERAVKAGLVAVPDFVQNVKAPYKDKAAYTDYYYNIGALITSSYLQRDK
jgi:hypothetical protein